MEKTLLSIALILVATKLGGIVSRKLKMPEVLGALLAGIILGPLVLNLVKYDENIKLLSNLGVILLMFLAGLESDVEQLKKAGKSSFLIALLGVAAPLVLGTLSAFLVSGDITQNIFIGVILTATSISISVETLTELGKLNSRVGVNILGAAVIDDILGLILISTLLAYNTQGVGLPFFMTLLVILLFCAGGILAIVFIPRLLNKYMKNVRPGRTVLTLALAGALLMAFVAEESGIAAITGAYLFGLLLSQLEHKEYLERNVKAISSGFLSLIFFASIGLQIELNGINAGVLLMSAIMFVVAVLGKVVGCGLGARAFRLGRSESLQVGVGMISRGEVAIITANIGLQNNMISQEVFIPTLIVVLLTTVVTPILLKVVFSHKVESRLGGRPAGAA
ncbi:sodium/proton-potassium antiporter GerN, CPA2 family (TC 2.A.37.2.2) [Sporobacter termitidis DSM 10068]|uniref:Sodium/proton-potassium antiporter GerN, CPA2 family (TC 2.A.37.2.2) n=1 Tax=Sporobacter termitidis DSM 10068 TaxID=1123282 RepID=A0A1M5UPU5_9FIRM|nr:cation:proton antiporter [Sporobacter termitidis]SHH65017.1 sodium/proton-potassium antiporter GerN, CPA2 family (TC 2.A.37.2.2) [Sporobacter termitidis DSM 10068]